MWSLLSSLFPKVIEEESVTKMLSLLVNAKQPCMFWGNTTRVNISAPHNEYGYSERIKKTGSAGLRRSLWRGRSETQSDDWQRNSGLCGEWTSDSLGVGGGSWRLKDQRRARCWVNVTDKWERAHSWDFYGLRVKQGGQRGNGQLSLAASVEDGGWGQQESKAGVEAPGWIELCG